VQPLWLIRQIANQILQKRNLDHLTQARIIQVYLKSNLDPKKSSGNEYDDLSAFLPHPVQWQQQNSERVLNISRQTALEFLQSYNWLNDDVVAIFDEWQAEIQQVAQGS